MFALRTMFAAPALSRRSLTALLLAVSMLTWVACTGVQTPSEKDARRHKEEVSSRFRPGDETPILPTLTPATSLDGFLRYAALRHPSVESAYYEWASSIERITVARSLPDPVFTLGIDVQKGLENDVTQMVMAVIGGLMTELPGPGKLEARADLQSEESKAQFARFQLATIEAALAAREVYYELFLVGERVRVTEQNLALVHDMQEAATRRAEGGLATLQDVLQAESNVARLENDLENLRDKQRGLAAAWKSALGIPVSETDPPIPASFFFSPENAANETTLADVLESNPRLRVMQAEIKRAEAGLAVAYKSRVPDFTLGMEAEVPTTDGASNPRDTIWQPRVGMTLPIWRDRIAAEVADSEAMKMAANAKYSAEQLALAREFSLNAFGIREVTRNLKVLRETLLPRQREIVELSQRGYQGGVTTFFELIEQQRVLLELELAEAEGLASREKLIGELNLALAGNAPIDLDPAAEGDND